MVLDNKPRARLVISSLEGSAVPRNRVTHMLACYCARGNVQYQEADQARIRFDTDLPRVHACDPEAVTLQTGLTVTVAAVSWVPRR